ncbi:MAG TPA: isoaspartyl peptidase/L-asparaginase family protein [Methylomirabilota bacterium]|nr:isoaspartyl peptidase/L-asparaginase family protein [Methylomirabilota bacterium]
MTSRVPALIVHGGAGADPASGREERRRGIREAVAAGWAVLLQGGGAVEAIEAAVCAMEDDPSFNAGRGSVLTTEGTVEMDASIMEGDGLKSGAVACVTAVRHPISLARRILEDGRHSFYVGEGAMARARALGIPVCDPEELITDAQRKRLESLIRGTVGAVALDRRGLIAAATSTGGTAGKLPGRVGDSPLIGCGTYAESTSGGVSCTGDGEAIIRVVLARRTIDILKLAADPMHACQVAMDVLVEEGRGGGGLICIDWKGRLGWAHSTPLMPVGFMAPGHDAPELTF